MKCVQSWRHSSRASVASPPRTTSSTTAARGRALSHRCARSIGATASWPLTACATENASPTGSHREARSSGTMWRPRRPAMDMIRYEHPLNERIRTLMRLEDLYGRAIFFTAQAEPQDHHTALLALFESIHLAGRAD